MIEHCSHHTPVQIRATKHNSNQYTSSPRGLFYYCPNTTKSPQFHLQHGGDVDSVGNGLFNASQRAIMVDQPYAIDSKELRRHTVCQLFEDIGFASEDDKKMVRSVITHIYNLDLKSSWGIHIFRDLKILTKKTGQDSMDSAIVELLDLNIHNQFQFRIYRS